MTTAPTEPTNVRVTHTGTRARVSFTPAVGATSYTITCNDVGETDVTGTSGEVFCGPESEDDSVRVTVQANNSAGQSDVIAAVAEAT